MKKLSKEQKLHQIRSVRKKKRKNLKKKRKNMSYIHIKSSSYSFTPQHDKYLVIPGPVILGFRDSNSTNKLTTWIHNLRKITLEKNQRVKIDFSKSKNAEAFGFLRMLAEIDSIITRKGRDFIKIKLPKNNTALQVFQQTGLNSLLNLTRKIKIDRENVKFWHHIEGTLVEGEKAGKLIESLITAKELDPDSANALYEGSVEAITNTVMHAYKDHSNPENKWWMFAGIYEGNLIVTICDLGAGIPKTIKQKPPSFKDQFINVFDRLFREESTDSQLIELAMEIGKSKTGQAHRGLGMAELLKFIDSAKAGILIILSGKGRYRYNAMDNSTTLVEQRSSIKATLIGWSVPINSISTKVGSP